MLKSLTCQFPWRHQEELVTVLCQGIFKEGESYPVGKRTTMDIFHHLRVDIEPVEKAGETDSENQRSRFHATFLYDRTAIIYAESLFPLLDTIPGRSSTIELEFARRFQAGFRQYLGTALGEVPFEEASSLMAKLAIYQNNVFARANDVQVGLALELHDGLGGRECDQDDEFMGLLYCFFLDRTKDRTYEAVVKQWRPR